MRRPVGWTDRDENGKRRDIRVSFKANDIFWQYKTGRAMEWSDAFTPTREHWQILVEKLLELKQRGHLFDREIEAARKKASAAE